MEDILSSILKRRSYYSISKESTIKDECIIELIKDALKHTPSAFNMQSQKVIVLLHQEHDKLWDIVIEELRKKVPQNKFDATQKKIESFKMGYGTVLFFDDSAITQSFANKFTSYQDQFETWAQQGNGMLQYVIWTLLESEGLGASLQHYNPLIDAQVKAEWNIPASWKLIAQMPFGKPTQDPMEKQFDRIEERMHVYR